jgi:hypothetical protein
MFPWSSKKIARSVTFDSEIPDATLLAVIEEELEKQPHKTFSELCKEALWQFLRVPESVRPNQKPPQAEAMEQLLIDLKRQLTGVEQRFFTKESRRLEEMEQKLNELSQQMSQLSDRLNQISYSQPSTLVIPEPEELAPPPPPVEVDPVIARLGAFLDDF